MHGPIYVTPLIFFVHRIRLQLISLVVPIKVDRHRKLDSAFRKWHYEMMMAALSIDFGTADVGHGLLCSTHIMYNACLLGSCDRGCWMASNRSIPAYIAHVAHISDNTAKEVFLNVENSITVIVFHQQQRHIRTC